MNHPTLRKTQLAALIAGAFACNQAAALTVNWIGSTSDDFWSTAANWATPAAPGAPGALDDVFFGAIGSGGRNTVDRDFTIRSLRYWQNSEHRTRVLGGRKLSIAGPVDIGVGDPSQSAAVTWSGGGEIMIGSAAAPTRMWIGVNDSGAASGTTTGSLTLEDISVVTFLSELSIGRKAYLGGPNVASNASGTLTLGSPNSSLTVGTAATRANVDIGVNFQSLGSATGLLDATQGNVKIHADEFNLGYSPFEIGGAATGTLRWDSPNTLDANAIYISRGMGSGILELASGATFISRSSVLALAYNDSGSSTGTTLANLDLTVNNPTFSAFVGSVLFIGNKAYLGEFSVASNANGSLILGSNSNLTVGTAAARAYVYVGVNSQGLGSATGLLDARQGRFEAFASTIDVAVPGGGAAAGTLYTGARTTIDTTTLNIGTGTNATGVFHLTAGVVTAATTNVGAGGEFDFTGGRFNAKDFNDPLKALDQKGGTLAPGLGASFLTITAQGYRLASAGLLEIDLLGEIAGTEYDRLVITGGVNLNSNAGLGGILDLVLGFGPTMGTSFLIIENDGTDAVVGRFRGLSEGGRICEMVGQSSHCFQITYFGGTGNDVVLDAVAVPEPHTWLLMLAGLAGVLVAARRRTRSRRALPG